MRRAFLAFVALAGTLVAADSYEAYVCNRSEWRQFLNGATTIPNIPGLRSGDTLPVNCINGELFYRRIQTHFQDVEMDLTIVKLDLYAVVYTVQEKCRECGIRHAVGCIPEVPDCGVPWKTVTKIEQFQSLDAAMKFINRKNDATWFSTSTSTLTEPGPVRNLPAKATLIGVYRMTEIGLTEKTKTSERPAIPQEPLVETIYEVKK